MAINTNHVTDTLIPTTGTLVVSGVLNTSGNLRAPAFRAAKGVPNSGDTSTVGFAFAGDGDTGLFAVNGTENGGTTQISFFMDNTARFTVQNDGNVWSSAYGWLHDHFFRVVANCATSNGANAVNCYGPGGNIHNETYHELIDEGGQVRLRSVRNFVNCNCACPADCNCGTCVVAGTLVLLADGRYVAVEGLQPGDVVDDGQGGHGVVAGLHQVPLGQRRLLTVNGVTISDDHPVLTTAGWAALDTEGVRRATHVVDKLPYGTFSSSYDAARDETLHTLQDTAHLVTPTGSVPAVIQMVEDADRSTALYSPILLGAGSFVTGDLVSGALRLFTHD